MSIKKFQFSSEIKKKRAALLSGNCGTPDRITLTGQIVDIPVTEYQLSQKWNYIHSLPENTVKSIRPIMDVGIRSIKNPYLKLEILNTESVENSSDAEVLYKSLPFYGDTEGFFQESPAKKINSGKYTVRIYFLHHLSEGLEDRIEEEIIGYGKLWVLDEDFTDYIATSDIDQTFLDTPVTSITGLIETLFETPLFKTPLPGMPGFYRALQKDNGYPLHFISASPHFFRRTLSSLFALHGMDPSGLYLKSFSGKMDGIIRKGIHSVMNLDKILEDGMKHAVNRSVKFLGSSLYNLVDQVAYKLAALLEHRLTQPTGAKEILIGDDSESDYFIFTLYQFLLVKEMDGKDLETYLYELRFQEREAFTADTAAQVRDLIDRNQKIHGKTNSVCAVWIHSSKDESIEDLLYQTMSSLPEDISSEEKLTPFRIYKNTFELALISIDAGALKPESISKIWKELSGKTVKGIQYNLEYAEKTINNFPFKNADKKELISSFIDN